MNRIERLLRQEIGLDAASIGSSLIERTVRLRMKRLGLKNPGDYERLLGSSRAEWDELIEAVVVTETWFFRDRDPFNAFTQLALEWFPQHPTSVLRVLSVPCSSGEEPYSLAMALLDAGCIGPLLSPESTVHSPQSTVRTQESGLRTQDSLGHKTIPSQRFVIDAVDISTDALARARQAVYGKNSFRGKELAFRDRHFSRVSGVTCEGSGKLTPDPSHPAPLLYALNRRVRDCVQFHRDNLLGEEFLVGHAPYDFVFCRNLLIYFDRATQVRALNKLHRLLAPDGLLFVGPAELPLVIDNGFVNANLALAFACRKAVKLNGRREPTPFAVAVSSAPSGWPPPQSRVQSPQSRVHSQGLKTQDSGPTTSPEDSGPWTPDSRLRTQAAHSAIGVPTDLDAARQLADAGRFEEAVGICEEHLRKEGPSAQAYYLLGLLSEAKAESINQFQLSESQLSAFRKAIDYYRKALYLEPNHYETLLQMSLLLEKTGDTAGARTFKSRATRAAKGVTKS